MNILFIIPEYYPHSGGGISTYYQNYIAALKPSCNKIKVIVGSGYAQSDNVYDLDGIEIAYLKPGLFATYLNKFTKLDLFPELKRNIAAAWAMYEQANHGEGFDIIECTDFALGFIPWVIDHHKPVITRMHGSTGQITLHEDDLTDPLQNDITRQTELLLLRYCDTLITHSTANQVAWEQLLSKPVAKIYPVINNIPANPVAFSSRNNYGLVTARIQKCKGAVELSKAVAMADEKVLPIRWYGRDTAHSDRRSTSVYLKEHFPDVWGKKILPQKALSLAEIEELQKNARFGVIASIFDMFNLSCVEFMCAGTPLICSEGAGSAELIEHGVNGFKYKADDIRGLADCLITICGMDEQAYNNMALAGISTIKNELSAEKLIAQNLAQYEKLIANFKPEKVNAFLNHIYLPSERQGGMQEILDKQTIKNLAKYLFKRIKDKFTSRP